MRSQVALLWLSAILVIVGIVVAAAFYALVPGYRAVYLLALVLALFVGFIAYRAMSKPQLRSPAGSILSGCTVYWVLGGSLLPNWANGAALIFAPLLVAGGLTGLIKARDNSLAPGS
jgi:hypothetical protein